MDEGSTGEAQVVESTNGELGANENGRLDAESLRRLRLIEFLRELVRAEGRMEAAGLLGVNYKTLVRAEESGQITGRMGDALERLLLSQSGPGEMPDLGRVGDLEERVASLEARMESLAQELRDGLGTFRAVVEDRGDVQGNGDQGQERDGVAERAEVAVRLPVTDSHRPKPSTERRPDRGVVSEEPADDDPIVYGAAWPVVKEWRRLRASHPNRGTSLSWLAAEERLLKLELAMLEDHGLTLPPVTQPLKGFARRGQTNWRRTALHDTRKARARRSLLRWVTLGLWWR